MRKHPTSMEKIIALFAGELTPEEASEVERMIAGDPALQRRWELLETLRQTVAQDDAADVPAEVIARAKGLFREVSQAERAPEGGSAIQEWLAALDCVVARLIFDSRRQPALAGFRCVAELVRLSYETDIAEIDLELDTGEEQGKEIVTIFGQISAADDPGGAAVVLTAPGMQESLAQTVCDASGMFKAVLPRGTYDLHLRLPAGVVSIADMEI